MQRSEPNNITNMDTKDYIDRIEALRADLDILRAKHGIQNVTILTAEHLGGIPVSTFVELCDHYGIAPSDSVYPSAWTRHEGVSICLDCVRIEMPKPTSAPLERLRALVPEQANSAAA